MDCAGPFPTTQAVPLEFTLPNITDAVLGDLTIEFYRDGALETPTPTLYLISMGAGTDKYHLSNRDGLAYLASSAEVLYISIEHTATGRTRLLHVAFVDVAPTAAAVADAVWDEAIASHNSAGTFGLKNQLAVPSETIGDYKADVSGVATSVELAATELAIRGADSDTLETLSDQIDTLPTGTAPTAASVADAVWDEAIADHDSAGSFGLKNQLAVPSETIGDYKADVSALATSSQMVEALGLMQKNFVLSDQVYETQTDVNGATVSCLISATVTTYTDNTKSVIVGTYTMTATYEAGINLTYQLLEA